MAQETTDVAPLEQPGDPGARQLSGCWGLILVWLAINIVFMLFTVIAGVLALFSGSTVNGWSQVISGTLLGLILLVVAINVSKRKKWARIAVVVVLGLNILFSAIQLLSGAPATVSIAALPCVYGVYWILTNPETY